MLMAEKGTLPAPDQTADQALTNASITGVPVDLGKLVACWDNLVVVHESIDGPGYLLPLGSLGGEIIVNTNDPLERQRFTIAHEMGHWILGRIWEKKTGEFQQPPGIRHETLERWCDQFAACLLIPRSEILERFRKLRDPGLINRLVRAPIEFQVSEDAFFIRMWEVLCVHVAVIERQGRGDRESIRIARSWGDEKARTFLQTLLENDDLSNEIRSPFFFFRAHAGRTRLVCSGKHMESVAGRVILALADVTDDFSHRLRSQPVNSQHVREGTAPEVSEPESRP